jgi:hypothetical protein
MAAHPSLVSRDPYFRSIVDALKRPRLSQAWPRRVSPLGGSRNSERPEASWCFTGIGRVGLAPHMMPGVLAIELEPVVCPAQSCRLARGAFNALKFDHRLPTVNCLGVARTRGPGRVLRRDSSGRGSSASNAGRSAGATQAGQGPSGWRRAISSSFFSGATTP